MDNVKITVFGDSIAKGLELKNGRPQALETNAVEMLQKYYNIEIKNNSCFGQTITRLKNKGYIDKYLEDIDKTKNNILVFCIGGNDSDFDWKQVNETPKENHECRTSLNVFMNTYIELIEKLKQQNVKVFICALPIVSAKKFLENYICTIAQKENVLTFFDGDISNITRHQELYNRALQNIAKITNSQFLDIREPFLQVKNINDYYCEDGMHPNIKGHKLIADEIITFCKKNNFVI